MDENNHHGPGLGELVGKIARTGLGAFQNRAELFSLEVQEEKAHLFEMVVCVVGFLFLAMMGAVMLTAFIVYLFPENLRVYALAGFALLYLIGAFVAWKSFMTLLKHEPFADSFSELRKDASWLESLK